jgi:outer membrane protein assembly factor BamE (lipoprotein component of BamABCDE complex)
MNGQRSSRVRLLVIATTISLLPLAGGGCLVSSQNKTSVSGRYVSSSAFSEIKPGSTSGEWVRATLGEPTNCSKLADGTEIWKWSYTETKDGQGTIFLLFSGSDQTTTQANAFVEVKDGVVTKKWRDAQKT